MLRHHTAGINRLPEHGMNFGVMAVSSLVAVGGILAAVYVYRLRAGLAERMARAAPRSRTSARSIASSSSTPTRRPRRSGSAESSRTYA